MVSGPAISCDIFFEISGTAPTARLRALDTQEVWLESTDQPLEALAGVLEFSAEGPEGSSLRRDAEGYTVRLPLDARETLVRRLAEDGRAGLRLMFDVEYREGYESPGGYSAAHGVRYWDDVTYPLVRADRFEIFDLPPHDPTAADKVKL